MEAENIYLGITLLGGFLTIIIFFFPIGDIFEAFNPMEWVSTFTIFGASGYILTKVTKLSSAAVIGASVMIAAIGYLLIHFFIVKPMENAESSLAVSEKELEGKVAEVITSIPAKGFGEIIVNDGMTRRNMSAKSFDEVEIKSGISKVVIVTVEDGVARVSKLDD